MPCLQSFFTDVINDEETGYTGKRALRSSMLFIYYEIISRRHMFVTKLNRTH